MEIMQLLNSAIESIPKIIISIKNFALTTLGLSAATYTIVAFFLAILGAFYFIKQFVVGSAWARISTILNFILLSIIFYLLLNPMVI
ncbi:MAG: hypothetical protein AABY22_12155 [Nanoarchaeota archaeon]